MNPGSQLVLIIVIAIIAVVFIISMVAKLYHRASKEISFVRTGWRGQKVIMNGGAIVLPVFHEIIKVNMNTLRLEVRRADELALITKDRMRVDVTAEFYVRVKPTIEAIADAAQTLGKRTLDPKSLKELVEGKFVDALRAVAAEMAMEELHEKRVDFVQKVQTAVSEDLLKNGLELESASLTALDQTNKEYFNPDNAFDAEGLTKLTEEIENRRKQRNDIEQDTSVKIKQKTLEAERERLNIQREEEYAKLAQKREIEVRQAEESAETAIKNAEKKRLSEEAEIQAREKVELARILTDQKLEEGRIEKEKMIKEKDILKARAVEEADIDREKTVKLADQGRQIAIAEKSKEQSLAQTEAEQARAKAVKAEEEVTTVKENEIASRQKQIDLIKAAQEAEKDAIAITVAAEAEKKASSDRAEAVRIRAEAEAQKHTIIAGGEAEAEKLKAAAAAERYKVEAEGKKALHMAENILSGNLIEMKVKLAIVENLSAIIAASVKPMEKIDDIKIIQVDGLTHGGGSGAGVSAAGAAGGLNLADQVVNSALRYRGQAPLVDALLKEIGLQGDDIKGLTKMLKDSVITETDDPKETKDDMEEENQEKKA